jgi:hypothetical protein
VKLDLHMYCSCIYNGVTVTGVDAATEGFSVDGTQPTLPYTFPEGHFQSYIITLTVNGPYSGFDGPVDLVVHTT